MTFTHVPAGVHGGCEGQPLHSWRTLILPFLEQEALYKQIHLDEPWDSPHNRPIANTRIATFCCPSDPTIATSSSTCYMAIVGPGTIFEGAKSIPIAKVLDGTSNTLLVVEVDNSGTSWMAPIDLKLDTMQMKINGGPRDMRSRHPGEPRPRWRTAPSASSATTLPAQTLRSLATRNDGQVVPDDW